MMTASGKKLDAFGSIQSIPLHWGIVQVAKAAKAKAKA